MAGVGSLTQLSANGQQSKAVTGHDYSPFKTVVRRVTPFATAPKDIQFTGQTQYGKTAQAHIPRVADLLTKVWLVFEFGKVSSKANGTKCYKCVEDVARAIIEEVSIEAGSITYQTLYPEWMVVKEELCTSNEKHHPLMTGKKMQGTVTGVEQGYVDMAYSKNRFYVALPFFFSRTYGHALPVVNLHLTDVTFKVKLRKKEDVIVPTDAFYGSAQLPGLKDSDFPIENMYMLGEYVYLSDAERAKFANSKHAYLIEQTQRYTTSVPSGVRSFSGKLTFNHPCKGFYWYGITHESQNRKKWLDWTMPKDQNWDDNVNTGYARSTDLFEKASISLNNNLRVQEMGPKYYGIMQMQQHHSRVPNLQLYMYSFALAPESVQPSGNLNASRIETISLDMKFQKDVAKSFELVVYTENYNIVRITSGIAMLSWAS